jgi:ribonuclease Z
LKIIPFGTSSGRPTTARNVSGLAVVGESEWWLFDCGEGTQMQIARAGLSLHKLAGIFITHLHGDHFNGLPGLMSTMALEQRQKELVLAGPPGITHYLETLGRLRILHYHYPVELHELSGETFRRSEEIFVYESPRHTVVARPLDHRIYAIGYRVDERMKPGRFDLERARELGIPAGPLYGKLQRGESIELPDGRVIQSAEVVGPPRPGQSVAYCLDTRPCANSEILARDVDWLIHEATYTQELTEEARTYGHSTAQQAAETARAAKAKNLLITHFSSRYPDARPLLEEARAIFPPTVMAQDLMEIEV